MSKETPKKSLELKLSDQAIGHFRELLQLSMLSGTNFVDHCRALRLEESQVTPGSLILSMPYVEGWNKMAEDLQNQAKEKAKQMSQTVATEEPDTEVVISRDPKGKLVGTRQKASN